MDYRLHELILTRFAECYGDEHSTSKKAPYRPEANDVWSLGVLFLDLVCGDRIWEAPATRDEGFRKFSEDPSDFLRSAYPLNARTRHLLLRIFCPEQFRISLRALREEISSINNFYLSDHEIAVATAQVQKNATRYGPWTKLAEGLGGVPHEHRVGRLFTNSEDNSSMGEFVDIALTTLENEPLPYPPNDMVDSEQILPRITGLQM